MKKMICKILKKDGSILEYIIQNQEDLDYIRETVERYVITYR